MLEAQLAQMRTSITTRRLAIVDEHGERITLTVDELGIAEVVVMAEAGNSDTAAVIEADLVWEQPRRGFYVRDADDPLIVLEVADDAPARLYLYPEATTAAHHS